MSYLKARVVEIIGFVLCAWEVVKAMQSVLDGTYRKVRTLRLLKNCLELNAVLHVMRSTRVIDVAPPSQIASPSKRQIAFQTGCRKRKASSKISKNICIVFILKRNLKES